MIKTKSGLEVKELARCSFCGWVGFIYFTNTWDYDTPEEDYYALRLCYDMTVSEVDIYNPVAHRTLIKGELDIDLNTLPAHLKKELEELKKTVAIEHKRIDKILNLRGIHKPTPTYDNNHTLTPYY